MLVIALFIPLIVCCDESFQLRISNEAVRILTSDSASIAQKAQAANEIQGSPGRYNPWALLELGLYKLRHNHFEDAALFLRAAVFRLLVDLKSSKDPSLNYVAELAFENIRNTVSKYVNTPAKHLAWTKALTKADEELENWDRRTPRDYDERWIFQYKLGNKNEIPKAITREEKQKIIEEMYQTFRENGPLN